MLSVIFEWHSKDLLYGQNNEDSLLLFPYIYIPCTVHVCAKSFQPCPTLCNPMDYSPPGSSVHGLLQQAYWSGLPCPPPGDRPDPEIKSMFLVSPPLAGVFLPLTAPVKPLLALHYLIYFVYQTCKATTCLLYYKTKVRQLKTFMYSFILK